MRYIGTVAFISVFLTAQPARAQEAPLPPGPESPVAQATEPRVVPLAVPRTSISQRALLLSMYVGNGALQGYDAYATLKALTSGGTEANPIMAPVTRSGVGFVMVKAGMSAVTIYTAERLWRTNHRGRAIAVIAISNGLMAIVDMHNHSVLRRLR